MDAMADALIFAVTYINCRGDDEDDEFVDDVGALESIAAFLQNATAVEQGALAAAADRALAQVTEFEENPRCFRAFLCRKSVCDNAGMGKSAV